MALELVQERLAACVNIVPMVTSFYWWEDAVQTDDESLLIVKTTVQKFDALMQYVLENHEYELPEIIGLPISSAYPDYVNWVKAETSKS
ncbi:divalent-cation tolerance protein CutA [candidate division GN15 bacterium]|uniref:Divalent-cation tolerance protein CutA n=1 Tax=candidate division GN15 bacterium TaxID=2072418 RepID=A0A855X2P2_9BACT|nr:MAG: divalent-cation tolerance protein CutA [candidate division GN15 bacterium]